MRCIVGAALALVLALALLSGCEPDYNEMKKAIHDKGIADYIESQR